MNIFELPAEDIFVDHLAKYLTLRDLFILRCCSQKCKYLVSRILAYRKEIIVCSWQIDRGNVEDPSCDILSVLSDSCRNLRRIYFIDIWWMRNNVLRQLLSNNANLEVVDILGCSDITDEGLQPLTTECTKVTSLMIESTQYTEDFLKAINLHNNHLIEVNLSQCYNAEGYLTAFFKEQPHLRTILLCAMPRGTQIGCILRTIAEVCREVENLDIRRNENVEDQDVLNVATKCLKIRYLLTNRNHLSDQTNHYLAKRGISTICKGYSYEKHPFYMANILGKSQFKKN